MRNILLILLTIATFPFSLFSQAPTADSAEQFGIEHLCEYLNLRPDDIHFRSDYTEPDSFRLEKVTALMDKPLGMIGYTAELRNAYVKSQPEVLAAILFEDMTTTTHQKRLSPYKPTTSELQRNYNLYYTNATLNQMLTKAALYIDIIIPKSTEKALAQLTRTQRSLLTNEFKELLVTREEEEFYSVEKMDSLEKAEEQYTEQFAGFGTNIHKEPIIAAGIDFLQQILPELNRLRKALKSGDADAKQIIKGTGYLPDDASESYLGKQPGWKIGGLGDDIYTGDFKFILDFGGNDVYNLKYNPKKPHPTIIIDLGGDDLYRSLTDFTIASGCLSVGVILDYGGDDRYDARSFGIGSGYFGFGLLYDASGDDRYDGDTHVEGAGAFGLGVLVDEKGRDMYNAALYSQGFGFVEGFGAIYDISGSDSYYAGGKYKDILRYDEHYLSLSQGFGYGLRPWMSGGIGTIVDWRGNDSYYSDIFGQGASYWWSLGVLYDSSGNDYYQSYQYAQGTGTHMTLGILVDDFGNDVYFGKGLMQGVGHDYSCGIMLDRNGNDTYTAYDLSQGAGSANGVGVLIDVNGEDRYFIKNKKNTHGYGNPRRSFGSIGLFIDLGGSDQYTGYGDNNFYWQTDSRWGGGMDIELYPPDSTGVTEEAGK